MCTSLLIYDVHPALLLLLTFNRDEYFDRATQPAHFWPDEPSVLAGRDALRMGTWLGLTTGGRFSLLTNYREPMSSADPGNFPKTTDAPSRGALTTDFLTGSMSPLEYLQGLPQQDYCGFNLLVGDLQQQQLAYLSNRGTAQPQLLPPGCYGVSNGLLQQWPKVQKGLSALLLCLGLEPSCINNSSHRSQPQPQSQSQQGCSAGEEDAPGDASSQPAGNPSSDAQLADAGAGFLPAAAVSSAAAAEPDAAADAPNSQTQAADGSWCSSSSSSGQLPWGELFHSVMGDVRKVAAGEQLPLTGIGEDTDRRLSSIFVEPLDMRPGGRYGTRSQTIIAVWRDGRVEQRERYIETQDGVGDAKEPQWAWQEAQHSFRLTLPLQQPQQQQQQQRAAQCCA